MQGVGTSVKGRMLSGAALIAMGSIVAKLLGALYRIPLTNILGAEGMGIYQLVFPVFALFTVLATAGIPTALSRIVAEKRALGQPTKRYLTAATLLVSALGCLLFIVTFALADQLALWQGNGEAATGFRIVAPAILLVGLIAALRGWFQGELYMLPTAISNIIEQLVKLGAGIGLSLAFAKNGVTSAVNGALLGVAISEAAALLYLVVTYFVRSSKLQKERLKVGRDEAREMFKIAFPIAIVALLMPLSNFFDSIIIVNMLRLGGSDRAAATALYGLLTGPVGSMVNMPVVVIMSLAVVVVPSVSVSRVKMDIDGIMLKSRLSVKLAYLVGIPSAFFFAVFAGRIVPVIYPSLSAAQLDVTVDLLRICAANIVLLSAMQIYISLLQALGRTGGAVLSLGVAIVVKVALSLLFTRFLGIKGGALASVVMAATALAISNSYYFKICGLRLEKNVGLNLLAGVIMALTGLAIGSLVKNNIAAIVVGFAASAAAYIWLVLLFNVIDRQEIEYMPMRRALRALRRVVRFWEYRDEKIED